MIKEYQDEIMPWVWDQTDKNSVLLASLMEENVKDMLERSTGRKSSNAAVDYDVAIMLKRAIASAKSSLAIDEYFSSSSSKRGIISSGNDSPKPSKPAKPSKLAKPKLTMEAMETAPADDADAPIEEKDATSAVEDAESASERAEVQRQSALAQLESECEETRVALEKLKEEIP